MRFRYGDWLKILDIIRNSGKMSDTFARNLKDNHGLIVTTYLNFPEQVDVDFVSPDHESMFALRFLDENIKPIQKRRIVQKSVELKPKDAILTS